MQYTILLLEDDLQLNQTVKKFLELKDFQVISAIDSIDAQDLFYENRVDLMILDVKVPSMNGFEFLKKIRENSNTPAIFITSLNSVDDVEKGFKAGADDYIRKPFELKELLLRIEALLKKEYKNYSNIVKIDNELSFDIKELNLLKNNKRVPLKTKELKLLSLFLKYPDKIVDYDTINSYLWDFYEEPSPASLRTYVKSIRAIIGKDKIETIKNVGYRFVSK